jgi:hypothetical protein
VRWQPSARHTGKSAYGPEKKGIEVKRSVLELETISKIGFWFKIAAEPSFPALLDSPSDLILLVGRKPEVRLRRIEDLKRGTNKDIGPKDIFEMVSSRR